MNENDRQNIVNYNEFNHNEDFSNNGNNATNTFNLIIGIATLLIAILGATFAYFSATARSEENDVTVKSAYVSISYDGGTEIKASNLIPSSLNVAIKKYQKELYYTSEFPVIQPYYPNVDNNDDGIVDEQDGYITDYDVYRNDVDRKCVDAKGKEVCYVYQFTIVSDGAAGEETPIIASIKVNTNEFDNLSYILYEVDLLEDEEGNVLKDKYGFSIVDIENNNDAYLYQYSDTNDNFKHSDTNSDVGQFKDLSFYKFSKPTKKTILGENDEVLEEIIINPVACLFGYKENASDFQEDDTERCASKRVTNKVKHTYQLLIWLEETGEEQPEQGFTFEGTVAIEVSGGIDTGEYGNGEITGQE